MAPGVAMAHRIERGRVGFIDDAVLRDIGDAVVGIVGRLPLALEIIPEQAVIHRIGFQEIRAAQQRQFLLEQAGNLVLEREDIGIGRHQGGLAAVLIGEHERGILRVRVGLARHQFIEAGQARGRQQQRLIDPVIGVVRRQVLGPLQHGLVKLDQADVFDHVLGGVEGHRADVRSTRLLQHAAVAGRGIAAERGRVARLVGVDGIEHALDPTHDQLRDEFMAAIGLELRRVERAGPLIGHALDGRIDPFRSRIVRPDQPPTVGGHRAIGRIIACIGIRQFLLGAVADVEELVGQGDVRAAGELNRSESQPLLIDRPAAGIGILRGGELVQGRGIMHPPLVIDVGRVAAEVAGVIECDLVVEGIQRGDHLDAAAVALLAEADHMQCHRAAGLGIVVLRQGHIPRRGRDQRQHGRIGHQRGADSQTEGRHDRTLPGFGLGGQIRGVVETGGRGPLRGFVSDAHPELGGGGEVGG